MMMIAIIILSTLALISTPDSTCLDRGLPPIVTISFGSNKGREYSRAVLNAGAAVWALQNHVTDREEAALVISESDALIVPGASTFGGTRGRSETMLIQEAMRQGVPVLGICNGEQVINQVKGGSISKIERRWPDAIPTHHEKISKPEQHITIEEGSTLHRIFGTTSLEVNSHHKWAVDTLGNGLKITARSDDGIVEAIEGEGLLGLQFHPEIFASKGDSTFIKPFLWLVGKAEKRRASRLGIN